MKCLTDYESLSRRRASGPMTCASTSSCDIFWTNIHINPQRCDERNTHHGRRKTGLELLVPKAWEHDYPFLIKATTVLYILSGWEHRFSQPTKPQAYDPVGKKAGNIFLEFFSFCTRCVKRISPANITQLCLCCIFICGLVWPTLP